MDELERIACVDLIARIVAVVILTVSPPQLSSPTLTSEREKRDDACHALPRVELALKGAGRLNVGIAMTGGVEWEGSEEVNTFAPFPSYVNAFLNFSFPPSFLLISYLIPTHSPLHSFHCSTPFPCVLSPSNALPYAFTRSLRFYGGFERFPGA